MIHRLAGICFITCIAFTLYSCGPRKWQYVQPTGITHETGATIVGSKYADPNPFRGDLRVYLVKIDGKSVAGLFQAWDTPVIVSAGKHLIHFGVSVRKDAWGFGLAEYDLEAGKKYFLRGDPLRPVGKGRFLGYGWLEGADGRQIGHKIAVDVVSYKRTISPTIIFIPTK